MLTELIHLLRRRELIIADHAWRDRDPTSHLDALREVSESITAWSQQHRTAVDAKLRHYLDQASFAKALEHISKLSAHPD